MGCDKFLILTIPLANINERCKKEFECYKCGGDIIIDEEESIIEHFHCADLMELKEGSKPMERYQNGEPNNNKAKALCNIADSFDRLVVAIEKTLDVVSRVLSKHSDYRYNTK